MNASFIYDRHVTSRDFVGRKSECVALENLIRAGENVVIYEPPKSGKSSLIYHTLFNIKLKGTQLAVASLDIFNLRTAADFLTRLGSCIIRSVAGTPDEYSRIIEEHLKDTHFIFDTKNFSEKDEIVSLNWDPDENDMTSLFSLPARLAATTGHRTVVIIEEFQTALEYPEADKILRAMHKAFSETKDGSTSWIITGSKVNAMKKVFGKGGFFYRRIERLPLSRIDEREIVEFLRKGFLSSGKDLEREQGLGACRLFQSNIWYLNHFCSICSSLSVGYINEGIMMDALNIILSIHEPRFHAMMDSLTEHQTSFLKAVLDGVTKFSSTDIIEAYSLNSSANVKRVKDALLKKEIITFTDRDEPRILDPLFEYWARKKYFEMP